MGVAKGGGGGPRFASGEKVSRRTYCSLFTNLYHFLLDRHRIFFNIILEYGCIILQYAPPSGSPRKNFFSYLNNRLLVHDYYFTEHFY